MAVAAAALLGLAATAGGEVSQSGHLIVSLNGQITPRDLPRHKLAPVTVRVEGRVRTSNDSRPPQLRKITIALNRHGIIFRRGLPSCPFGKIESTTTSVALKRCRSALVGHGSFTANVALPNIAPFPARGKLLAFNGNRNGKQVILAHIYGGAPVPTTFVLPFNLQRLPSGTFGAVLSARLPAIAGDWGYVTGMKMTIHRRYRYHGKLRSFISASCPVPKGFPGATFTFARGSYRFADGRTVSTALTRDCTVRK